MKILDVEARQIDPGEDGFFLLFLHTDCDCVGVGEIACDHQPQTIQAAIEEVRRKVLGADPFDLNALSEQVSAGSSYMHDGVGHAVTTAVETACLDAVGKQLGVPVSQLFGGALREDVRLCATRWDSPQDSPATFARKARAAAASGFTAIKCNPFGPGDAYLGARELDRAEEILRHIREEVGQELGLIVDANGRFAPAEAVRVAKAIEPFHVMYLEDPINTGDPDSLALVGGIAPVPLAAGQRTAERHSFRERIERQLSDFVALDCSRSGGVLRARQFALLAESYFVPLCLRHAAGPISLAMNAHIAACAPNFHLAECPYPLPASWSKVLAEPLELRNGAMRVPSGPGLGLELRAELCEPRGTNVIAQV